MTAALPGNIGLCRPGRGVPSSCMRTQVITRLGTLGLALILPTLSGCWSHSPARPRALDASPAAPATPPAALPPGAWPRRDVEVVRPLLERTPREVFGYGVRDGVDPATLTQEETNLVRRPEYVVHYQGLHADCLLRIYEDPPPTETPGLSAFINGLMNGFTPNTRIVSSRTLESRTRRADLEERLSPPPPTESVPRNSAAGTTSLSMVAPAAPMPRIQALDLDDRLYLESGLPIRIPAAGEGGSVGKKPRGVIIHLHALAGNEFEPKVMEAFKKRGWVEISIKTQTEIECPIPEGWHAEIVRLTAESRELSRQISGESAGVPLEVSDWKKEQRRIGGHPLYPRYQEVSTRLRTLRAGGFQACVPADLPAVAATIADQIDQGLAGASYAVEAVLEYIKQQRPDLQGVPVALIGFSAGALATPTAAARVHDQIDAVVIIGGGCNLLRISQESTFADGGLKVRCGEEKVPRATVERLSELYLEASVLDPYHTALLIQDLPILQVHASTDTWVSAACGELLYERLNRPERLTMHGGHEFLFYFLPNRATWIANWVDRAVEKAKGGHR